MLTVSLKQSSNANFADTFTQQKLEVYKRQIERAIHDQLLRQSQSKQSQLGSTFQHASEIGEDIAEESMNDRGSTFTQSQFDVALQSAAKQLIQRNLLANPDVGDSQQIVDSVHDVSVGPRHSQTLDPIPATTAGQARFLFYEADGARASINSKDFDDMYTHEQSQVFGKKPNQSGSDDGGSDNMMTFGSRPPTAPQKDNKRDDFQTPAVTS